MAEPALLTAVPGAPIPPGGGGEWFTGARGARLRAALFSPPGPARGSVVLSSGRSEPIEKYFEVIGELLARGFTVLAHEWRGQGLSHRSLPDRLKGHATGFSDFLDDYRALLAAFGPRLPKPWIALGHSMGGCLTLLALAAGPAEPFAAAVLSAPMLGVKTGDVPLPLARLAARANRALGRGSGWARKPPADPYVEAFDGNLLTHDRARFARARAQIAANPDLALGPPTWGWLDFAFQATAYLAVPAHLKRIDIPVVIVSAENDFLVSGPAQREAAARLPQGRFVEVPGAYHEILMETDERRAVFWREFDAVARAVAPVWAAAQA